MEVAAIEQANRKEQEEFEEQMVELGRMLDNELTLPTMGGTMVGTGRFGSSSRSGGVGGHSSQMMGGTHGTGINHMDKTSSGSIADSSALERVQNFEEAFNKIKAATGITDIEELVKTFIKNEDHNFSLFNYVNEQNNEIEKYDEQIQLLREEERKFAQESGDDVHQHKQILKELEGKLQSAETMAEKYEMRCQDLQRAIESLKRGIQNIYEKFDLDDGFQAGDASVTESNMVHYLGLIEQKSNDVLEEYGRARASLLRAPVASTEAKGVAPSPTALSASTSQPNLVSVLGAGPKVPMGQELLHVNPPKLDDYQSDDDDDDDDDTRPFTREELKARTLSKLKKGQQGAGKSKKRATGAASYRR
jgi:coiled-coil domain-containing protein 63/114